MMFTPRPKSLGKENFLKLADGEEVTGIFRGTLYTFRRHWANNRSSECIGDGCDICDANKGKPDKERNIPAFRFRVNFITSKEGKWTAKIFEGGGDLYDALVGLDKKFDLTKVVVEISRAGVKQNTRYTVLPRVDTPLTSGMRTEVDALKLLPLSADEPVEAAK